MNFLKRLFRRRLSHKEQIRLKFRDAFDGCIKSRYVRSSLNGDAMMGGLLVYSAIANTYKSLKDNEDMQLLRSFCILQEGFDPINILNEELIRAMNKYCGMEIGFEELEKF